MKQVLKDYMLLIYKLTGDCKIDQFADLGTSVNYKETFYILKEIEKEILEETKLRKNNIKKEPLHIQGSLDKVLLQAEMLKNGFDNQLRYEGLI